jgi:hypothetical protein
MQILTPLSWQPVVGATGYLVNAISYVGTAWSETTVTAVTGNGVSVANVPVEEGVPAVYLIRAVGAAGYLTTQSAYYLDTPCLGWLRYQMRVNLQDLDLTHYPDSELNLYVREALREYSKHFPVEATVNIPVLHHQQNYILPADLVGQEVYNVQWQRFPDNSVFLGAFKDNYYLKRKPYKGGESPPQTRYTFPKLAIGVIRFNGRYYAGHYDLYGNQLQVDILPDGGENMVVTYGAQRFLPQQDPDLFDLDPDDLEIISLYARAKCAMRIEAQDTGLSRWRTREDGSRRNDSPVPEWSTRLFNAFHQRIREKKQQGVRTFRLTRV